MNNNMNESMSSAISFKSEWLGLIDIKETFKLQTEHVESHDPDSTLILGCEHPEVLSVGKSLWATDLSHYNSVFNSVDLTLRGGKLTLHNPGQLIIYPVLNLKSNQLTLRNYIQFILNISKKTFLDLGLNVTSNDKQNIGIFIDDKKIMSLGLHHHRGWVSHGLSINVNNDLEKFKLFEVCGQCSTEVTSLKTMGLNHNPKDVFELWVKNFLNFYYLQ